MALAASGEFGAIHSLPRVAHFHRYGRRMRDVLMSD